MDQLQLAQLINQLYQATNPDERATIEFQINTLGKEMF
jgi:hypothetical protein